MSSLNDKTPPPLPATRVPLGLPPDLCAAVGYQGPARYVAFWWTPYGDELCYADGVVTAAGLSGWPAWLAFLRHPLTRACLEVAANGAGREHWNFGSSDTEAEHALLCDRQEQTLDVVSLREAQAFLRSQPSEASALLGELDEQRFLELVEDAIRRSQAVPHEQRLAEAARQHEAAAARSGSLKSWLDETQRSVEDA